MRERIALAFSRTLFCVELIGGGFRLLPGGDTRRSSAVRPFGGGVFGSSRIR
jgi:hypothetical protein